VISALLDRDFRTAWHLKS